MNLRKGMLTLAAAAMSLAVSAGIGAEAQDWPTKPVRIVVGAAAGGSADGIARRYAEWLSQKLGGSFVVENIGGGGGSIGIGTVVNAPADGYTFLWHNIVGVTMLPHTRDVGYDPVTQLTLVALPGAPIAALGVPATLGVNTVQEFVDMAKKEPGKLAFASAGVGSVTHLSGAIFDKVAGIEMTHVPYQGGGPALIDLLAGRVQALFESGVLKHQGEGEGKLKVLAIIGTTPHPDYPDIPLIGDALPGYNLPSGHSVLVPKGTPQEIVERVRAAIEEINADPASKAPLLEVQFLPQSHPDFKQSDYDAYLASTSEFFAGLAKELDLKE